MATIARAEERVQAELQRLLPEGSCIQVRLQSGQRNPSQGVVISYPGGRYAYVGVRLTGGHVRSVAFRDICW